MDQRFIIPSTERNVIQFNHKLYSSAINPGFVLTRKTPESPKGVLQRRSVHFFKKNCGQMGVFLEAHLKKLPDLRFFRTKGSSDERWWFEQSVNETLDFGNWTFVVPLCNAATDSGFSNQNSLGVTAQCTHCLRVMVPLGVCAPESSVHFKWLPFCQAEHSKMHSLLLIAEPPPPGLVDGGDPQRWSVFF